MGFLKGRKNWILTLVSVIVLGLIAFICYYEFTVPKVFTKSEYIKEVVIQNKDFSKVLEDFLDQVYSYNGTKSATDKIYSTAEKFPKFVSLLEEKLGPRVPNDAKEHYEKMIAAYKIYLDAIEKYKNAVPKEFGDERSALLKEAKERLNEAQANMKNIK